MVAIGACVSCESVTISPNAVSLCVRLRLFVCFVLMPLAWANPKSVEYIVAEEFCRFMIKCMKHRVETHTDSTDLLIGGMRWCGFGVLHAVKCLLLL